MLTSIENVTGSLNDDDGTPGLSAGDTISYTITVNNPGNVSLTGVSVSDPPGIRGDLQL